MTDSEGKCLPPSCHPGALTPRLAVGFRRTMGVTNRSASTCANQRQEGRPQDGTHVKPLAAPRP
jgi:hypothetical protein